MKSGIHPDYKECKVKCACGCEFMTRATIESMAIEICSACHPFYTGKQKYVDTAGRVEKFQRKYAWAQRKGKQGAKEEQAASQNA